jgi:hypothetical protein
MIGSIRAGILVLVVAVVAAVLAGCGSSKKTTTTRSTTSTATAPATTTPTATKSYVLQTILTPGADVPKPKDAAGAHGTFTATITLHGTTGTLAWVLTFSHLSGAATAAHVHVGPPGKAGPVAIPLCGPCKSPNKSSFGGPIGGNARLLAALLHGGAYVNVHTKLNPGGEIRGQLTAKPGKAAAAPAPAKSKTTSTSPY